MVHGEFIKYMFWFFIEPVLYIINFIFSWGMDIQNSDTTPATSWYILYDILSLTNPTLLTADMILLCMKTTCT
jgi:hypothetical protein